MLVCLGVWSCGLWLMWYRSTCLLPLVGEPEVPSGWRAVIELARALETELASEGIDIRKLTDRQLKKVIAKHLKGGSVTFRSPLKHPDYKHWPTFISWIKREKWWILVFCLSGLPIALAVIKMHSIPIIITTTFTSSILLAGKFGHSLKSRVFMISILFMTGLIIGLAINLPTGVY